MNSPRMASELEQRRFCRGVEGASLLDCSPIQNMLVLEGAKTKRKDHEVGECGRVGRMMMRGHDAQTGGCLSDCLFDCALVAFLMGVEDEDDRCTYASPSQIVRGIAGFPVSKLHTAPSPGRVAAGFGDQAGFPDASRARDPNTGGIAPTGALDRLGQDSQFSLPAE